MEHSPTQCSAIVESSATIYGVQENRANEKLNPNRPHRARVKNVFRQYLKTLFNDVRQ